MSRAAGAGAGAGAGAAPAFTVNAWADGMDVDDGSSPNPYLALLDKARDMDKVGPVSIQRGGGGAGRVNPPVPTKSPYSRPGRSLIKSSVPLFFLTRRWLLPFKR